MDTDPEPRPKSKGEARQQQILNAIRTLYQDGKKQVTLQELHQYSGIRSFNTLTKQLLDLSQMEIVKWDRTSPIVILDHHILHPNQQSDVY